MKLRSWVAVGCVLAGSGVALGAFGVHALRERLEAADQLENWRTAVRYQVWHGLALVLVALVRERVGRPGFPAWAFLVGSVLFSGSIYCLALDVLRPVMGPLTPLGGAFLIAGWGTFAWQMLRRSDP